MPRKHKVLTYRGNIRKAKKRRLNAEQRLQDSQQQDGGNQEQELNNSAIQDQDQQPAPQILILKSVNLAPFSNKISPATTSR